MFKKCWKHWLIDGQYILNLGVIHNLKDHGLSPHPHEYRQASANIIWVMLQNQSAFSKSYMQEERKKPVNKICISLRGRLDRDWPPQLGNK